MTHEIKLREDYITAVKIGEKNFEVRFNDRGYQKGDFVRFIPISRCGITYVDDISARVYEITYVHSGLGLENGYVVFGIKEAESEG